MAHPVGLRAVGDLDGRGPFAANVAREPDSDILVAFARATKPRGN